MSLSDILYSPAPDWSKLIVKSIQADSIIGASISFDYLSVDNLSTQTGTISSTPVSANDITNKYYVDQLFSNLLWKNPVVTSSTINLAATYDNGISGVSATLTGTSNGALVLDDVSPIVTNRVLIKNQTSTPTNGIYSVTSTGSVSTPFVLTRTSDFDTIIEATIGSLIPVTSGTVSSNTVWLETAIITIIGTSPITFFASSYPPTSFFQVANNLSECIPATARTNLELGASNDVTFATTTCPLINGTTIRNTNGATGALGMAITQIGTSTSASSILISSANGGILINANGIDKGIGINTNGTGRLLVNTVAVPTISSADVLSNKTWNSNQITETYGGTNQTSYATGDTLFSSAANTLSKLPGNITATPNYLSQKGNGSISTAPVWKTPTQLKTDLSLSNVENTALSTWTGSANITTLGTLSSLAVVSAGLVVDTSGKVTNPKQPVFVAWITGDVAAVTGDSSGTSYTIICNTTEINVGTRYNTSTGVFTAPVAGTYSFECAVALIGLGAGAFGNYGFGLVRGGTNWALGAGGSISNLKRTDGRYQMCAAPIIWIAANDTITFSVAVVGYDGTKRLGIGGNSTYRDTRFSAFLLG